MDQHNGLGSPDVPRSGNGLQWAESGNEKAPVGSRGEAEAAEDKLNSKAGSTGVKISNPDYPQIPDTASVQTPVALTWERCSKDTKLNRVQIENIPEQLRAYRQWCLWRWEVRDGKRTKIPYQPNGHRASVKAPNTWSTFAAVHAAYQDGTWDGIGFVFTEDDPFCGLDIDKCISPNFGLRPEARELIDSFNTYTEVSPSGTGVKLIGEAKLVPKEQGGRSRSTERSIEIYDRRRFFTLTGNLLDDKPRAVTNCQEQASTLQASLAPPRKPRPERPTVQPSGQYKPLADWQIITKLCRRKKVARLWAGDWQSSYKSQSAGDQALCNHIAFFVGPDPARIASIFRQSGLGQREKADRDDYVLGTAAKAIQDCTAWYDPDYRSGNGTAHNPTANCHVDVTSEEAIPPQQEPPTAEAVPPAAQAEKSQPTREATHLSDTGNSICLVNRHGKDIRYANDWKDWLCWDGKRWQANGGLLVLARGRETVAHHYANVTREMEAIGRQIQAGMSDAEADAAKAQLSLLQRVQLHWLKTEACGRLKAMIDLARADARTLVESRIYNCHPWLLNLLNGTLNLRTGELREHRQEDLLTTLCPHEYDPNADCPLWKRFVRDIMEDDPALVLYLQQLAGMALTGDVSEQILPVLWGLGSNGKTVLLRTLLHVLGDDYGYDAPSDLLLTRKRDSHPTLLASLYGRRGVVCVETPDDATFDAVTVKTLTGGDRITARRMRQDYFTFDPSGTFFIATNERPRVEAGSYAMWRRLRLIPFLVRFEGARKDPKMIDKLKAEAAGILRWCVEGCLSWQRDGLQTPQSVMDATEEYRSEQDIIALFVRECCVTGSSDYRCKSGELFDAYRRWHEAGGYTGKPVNVTAFGKELTRLGFAKEESNSSIRRLGIALRTQSSDSGTAENSGSW